MIVFFDTETTGLPEDNAYLVQLGAVLTDNTGAIKKQLDMLIFPAGWTVPPAAQKIHGISTDDCRRFGVPLNRVLTAFEDLCHDAILSVAHNHRFDAAILELESCRLGRRTPLPKHFACTMELMTPLCNLPGPRGPKWPRLEEAYFHFFRCFPERIHHALLDALTCRKIFFELLRYGYTELPHA